MGAYYGTLQLTDGCCTTRNDKIKCGYLMTGQGMKGQNTILVGTTGQDRTHPGAARQDNTRQGTGWYHKTGQDTCEYPRTRQDTCGILGQDRTLVCGYPGA